MAVNLLLLLAPLALFASFLSIFGLLLPVYNHPVDNSTSNNTYTTRKSYSLRSAQRCLLALAVSDIFGLVLLLIQLLYQHNNNIHDNNNDQPGLFVHFLLFAFPIIPRITTLAALAILNLVSIIQGRPLKLWPLNAALWVPSLVLSTITFVIPLSLLLSHQSLRLVYMTLVILLSVEALLTIVAFGRLLLAVHRVSPPTLPFFNFQSNGNGNIYPSNIQIANANHIDGVGVPLGSSSTFFHQSPMPRPSTSSLVTNSTSDRKYTFGFVSLAKLGSNYYRSWRQSQQFRNSQKTHRLSLQEARAAVIRLGGCVLSAIIIWALSMTAFIKISASEPNNLPSLNEPSTLIVLIVTIPTFILALQVVFTEGSLMCICIKNLYLSAAKSFNNSKNNNIKKEQTKDKDNNQDSNFDDSLTIPSNAAVVTTNILPSTPTTKAPSIASFQTASSFPHLHRHSVVLYPRHSIDNFVQTNINAQPTCRLQRVLSMAALHPKLFLLSGHTTETSQTSNKLKSHDKGTIRPYNTNSRIQRRCAKSLDITSERIAFQNLHVGGYTNRVPIKPYNTHAFSRPLHTLKNDSTNDDRQITPCAMQNSKHDKDLPKLPVEPQSQQNLSNTKNPKSNSKNIPDKVLQQMKDREWARATLGTKSTENLVDKSIASEKLIGFGLDLTSRIHHSSYNSSQVSVPFNSSWIRIADENKPSVFGKGNGYADSLQSPNKVNSPQQEQEQYVYNGAANNSDFDIKHTGWTHTFNDIDAIEETRKGSFGQDIYEPSEGVNGHYFDEEVVFDRLDRHSTDQQKFSIPYFTMSPPPPVHTSQEVRKKDQKELKRHDKLDKLVGPEEYDNDNGNDNDDAIVLTANRASRSSATLLSSPAAISISRKAQGSDNLPIPTTDRQSLPALGSPIKLNPKDPTIIKRSRVSKFVDGFDSDSDSNESDNFVKKHSNKEGLYSGESTVSYLPLNDDASSAASCESLFDNNNRNNNSNSNTSNTESNNNSNYSINLDSRNVMTSTPANSVKKKTKLKPLRLLSNIDPNAPIPQHPRKFNSNWKAASLPVHTNDENIDPKADKQDKSN